MLYVKVVDQMNMKVIFAVMNTIWAVVKIRPVQDLNLWTLWYQCSALTTELKSQLAAGDYVGSK